MIAEEYKNDCVNTQKQVLECFTQSFLTPRTLCGKCSGSLLIMHKKNYHIVSGIIGRIKSFKLDAGLFGCELPVNFPDNSITFLLLALSFFFWIKRKCWGDCGEIFSKGHGAMGMEK
jgi:hypothetical protein